MGDGNRLEAGRACIVPCGFNSRSFRSRMVKRRSKDRRRAIARAKSVCGRLHFHVMTIASPRTQAHELVSRGWSEKTWCS